MKRFIVEFGMGCDFHGQDVTNAAKKAVKDAVSHSCLCGLTEILNIRDLDNGIKVKATVAVSRPEEVDIDKVKESLPVGEKEVVVVKGGLTVSGLYIAEFGDKNDSIEAALACVEVEIK
ncbi:hypothetical protein E8P77_01530 [Soehngenia saccharolytica]|nr:hypothetical protein E8P77_01530 [Soehngenia saccharolytica]